MADESPNSIYPSVVGNLTIWQRVRLDVFRMEYVVCSNTAPRGGRFLKDRASWSGPYWWWVAFLVLQFGRSGVSWAVPEERRQIHQIVVPSPVRFLFDWVIGLGCAGYAVFQFGQGDVGLGVWFTILAVSTLLVVPRLRGVTRSASSRAPQSPGS